MHVICFYMCRKLAQSRKFYIAYTAIYAIAASSTARIAQLLYVHCLTPPYWPERQWVISVPVPGQQHNRAHSHRKAAYHVV